LSKGERHVKITYNVEVNPNQGTATVTYTPKDAKFKPGDEVYFKANHEGVGIQYTGSPFTEDVDGKSLKLPAGPYTMRDHPRGQKSFSFACGPIVRVNGKKKLTTPPWKGGGTTPGDN
jgi:hypothetical protein